MAGKVIAIVAMDQARIIGRDNKLPWDLPEDRKWFAQNTEGQTVMMGRKTYESLPPRYRPLPKRLNVVVTRDPKSLSVPEGVKVITSPADYIAAFKANAAEQKNLWIAGGGEIYSLTMPLWDELYLTLVDGEHSGDAYFPPFEESFVLSQEMAGQGCKFRIYTRK